MKDKLILNVRCHIGIYQFAGQQTIDHKRLGEGSTMELNAVGVFITAKIGKEVRQVLIPFQNIVAIEMTDKPRKAA